MCKRPDLGEFGIPYHQLLHFRAERQHLVDAGAPEVAGAEAGDLYDIRMEAAAIIRKSAMDLMIQNHSLKAFGFKDVQYYQIVRDLIEEYRLLFIEWVAGFDKENYFIDRWGLFNPPGVGPFDKDPDDDIPFDPDSFMDFDPDED